MGRTIHIKMQEKIVQLDLSSDFVTESTIKSQFLLSPDAIVSLNYVDEGEQKGCECRNTPELSFVLLKNWPVFQFFVYSDKMPSRTGTPMDTSQNCGPAYVPIEVDHLVLEPELFLFYEKADSKACFTVITQHHAVSYNHGPHQNWNINSINNHAPVIICNQSGSEFETRIVMCNAEMDFVVVFSEVELVPTSPRIALPRTLERYILLGYPKKNSRYEALEGIFSSIHLDEKGCMRGSTTSTNLSSAYEPPSTLSPPLFVIDDELIKLSASCITPEEHEELSGYIIRELDEE
ncbi:unnamed protein product [Caenorhabditis sp. 36 PRJEB53466]|nr:unnamed protein product [Caenorhabditis sp. 36 PRJEB53466]